MCTSPLMARRPPQSAIDSGCKKWLFAPYDSALVGKSPPKHVLVREDDDHVSWVEDVFGVLPDDLDTGEVRPYQVIPCGQCMECRLKHSRMWADRCVCESLSYPEDHSVFLTLTFDDDHLVVPNTTLFKGHNMISPTTGALTLDFDVLSRFLKRFRKVCDKYIKSYSGIRYYACGEYGSKRYRPHFHAILFGVSVDELQSVPFKANFQGDMLYQSQLVQEAWPFGVNAVSSFNWQTAAYVSRYVTKKVRGKTAKEHYDRLGVVPEDSRMSRRPGLGYQFFMDHLEEISNYDHITLPAVKGHPHVSTTPRYFDKIWEKMDIDPLNLAKRKSNRSLVSEGRRNALLKNLGMSEEEYFGVRRLSNDKAVQSLLRLLE